MGTTIRRQPITSNIPAAPDYKFLNITNFGGIQKSSNPFVVSSNAASDCLNVYVDEDNALSTRPRLQRKYDLPKLANAPSNFKTLSVYKLHDGYLLHGTVGVQGRMYKFVETEMGLKESKEITGDTIPTQKCSLFEQNNVIYLLTGSGYKQIKNNVLSDVEGYIPTTTIGKWEPNVVKASDGTDLTTYQTAGHAYESRNLLSDKYKESYFWDGTWDIADVVEPGDVVENKYVKHEELPHLKNPNEEYPLSSDIRLLQYIKDASEKDSLYNYYLATIAYWGYQGTYGLAVVKTTKNNEIITEGIITVDYEETIISYSDVVAAASTDGLRVLVCPADGGGNFGIHAFERDSLTSDFDAVDVHVDSRAADNKTYPETFKMSSDGKVFIGQTSSGWIAGITDTSDYVWYVSHLTNDPYDTLYLTQGDFVFGTYKDSNGSLVWDKLTLNYGFTNGDGFTIAYQNTTLPRFFNSDSERVNNIAIFSKDSHILCSAVVYDIGYRNKLYCCLIYVNADDLSKFETIDSGVIKDGRRWSSTTIGVFDEKGEIFYYIFGQTSYNINEGGRIFLTNFEMQRFLPFETLKLDKPFVTDGVLYGLKPYGLSRDVITTTASQSEPLLEITKQSAKPALFEVFNKATKHQRFDNNTWFASGNSTFHTQYNDPTYIPESSYNDLGEDYEDITGLSIVNDNVLAAYKSDKIYIITPITIGDEHTYSYTETKNVVGNDVHDAPILTILTEMPTIVSYDGIYALNQLENVQSGDRITTLISEAINPLWLKENKSSVDNCKTLNRLYWTYYILPDEKLKISKIYLLDNRTQSWFYWELPIYVVSAMIKDNKTHLVTETGELYTLETSDIINKYNNDVTEYYDDLKKPALIPWYWTSQILSLNTINYAKRLVDTTFVVTDTDESDEYSLNYKFKAFRKNKNAETTELTLANDISFVESITKRTMIPRFNFIQFTLSNTEDDLNNNKLRLIGLGLKYVLLGGLY